MAPRPAPYPKTLYLIGAFKLFKGLILVAVGIGAIRLLNKDMAMEAYRWANAFRVDTGNSTRCNACWSAFHSWTRKNSRN